MFTRGVPLIGLYFEIVDITVAVLLFSVSCQQAF